MELNGSGSIQRIKLDSTVSTNEWLKQNPPSDSNCPVRVVTAEYQSGGKGQAGNVWESADGKNLLFSIGFRPDFVDAGKQFVLSEAIALSIAETVSAIPEIDAGDIAIKWPNDIYWKDLKLAGILIENSLLGKNVADCIAGVGLNVNQEVFLSDAPNPVSIRNITGHDTDRESLLEPIVGRFLDYCRLVSSGGNGIIHDRYMEHLYRRNGYHGFTDACGAFSAAISDVLPEGILVLKDRSGKERKYEFKQISYIM